MNKRKLKVNFYNPNTADDTYNIILKLCMQSSLKRLENVIKKGLTSKSGGDII